ncbi:MAG TPA: hypothetical protein VHP33_03300 [Polyangiaceae bacterium]|nr:hypothetical protein [Polyangiaceae bacterium]
MNHLAAAELHIRIARAEAHARNAMAELARAKPHERRKGERLTGNAWRRAKRHMRAAAKALTYLAQLQGGAL